MAEGSGPDLRPVFEEYLAQWRYTDDQVYVLNGGQERSSNGLIVTSSIEIEEYFQVAELYTVTFLGIASNEPASAIAWVEKAELTEQDRQVFIMMEYVNDRLRHPNFEVRSYYLPCLHFLYH
jgi:hypothetical protein